MNVTRDRVFNIRHFLLERVGHFNPNTRHVIGHRPSRKILMDILEEDQDILRDMTNLTEMGEGDISLGIGRALSHLASTVVDTGENLFDIFSEGVTDVGNITLRTTTSLAKDIVGIFDWAGGTPSFILFIIDGAIVVYLLVDYYQKKNVRRIPLQTIVQVKDTAHGAEPPIPTKPPLYRQNANMPSTIEQQTD